VTRGVDERMRDLRRWLTAARAVYEGRGRIAPDLVRSTGLTAEGVELGFASLEREATDAELRSLVEAAGDAAHVHVILSANVFVAPLRAIAIARAASSCVTVRPSPRDPALTRALVEAARDDATAIVGERDVAAIEADEIHVYGRDETIAEVRARARPGAIVRGHGAGLGIAVVTRGADLALAADALAADIVPFDQRGCMSPRVTFVEGDAPRGEAFARALNQRLGIWGERVPRGVLSDAERTEGTRWRDALAFAGHVWSGKHHVVALARPGVPLVIPPPGRHAHVAVVRGVSDVAALIGPIAGLVVAVGSDDPGTLGGAAPPHARIVPLGRMQHPPLDGPIDRRSL
jgi:hypothetical protein